jgi:hypothetical protein
VIWFVLATAAVVIPALALLAVRMAPLRPPVSATG